MTNNKTPIKKKISENTKPEMHPGKEEETVVQDHKKSNNTRRTINRTSKRSDKPFLIL